MTLKIIHSADIHLDTPFLSMEEDLRVRLAEAGRQAFRSLIDLCIEEEAQALIIAGDLFDNKRLSFKTEGFLLTEVNRAIENGIHVVVATGNHDPGRSNYRASNIGWPGGSFHLYCSRVPETYDLRNNEGEIVCKMVGAGHQTAQDTENIAARFPRPGGDIPSIALLHTQVYGSLGSEAHENYAPCTLDDIQALEYDYWALGHVHKGGRVCESPKAYYPGILQGRHFGETGPKGALVVTIPERGETEVRFVPLAPIRWEAITLADLEDAENLSDLIDDARDSFEAILEDESVLHNQEWMLRFYLSGACPLKDELTEEDSLKELAEEIESELDVLGVEVKNKGVVKTIDVDAYREQLHLLGTALGIASELTSDDSLLEKLAPQELAGLGRHASDEEKRDYLVNLLDGLEWQLAEALLKEPGNAPK